MLVRFEGGMNRTFCSAFIFGLLALPAGAAPFSENAMSCRAHMLWIAENTQNGRVKTAMARYAHDMAMVAREQAVSEGRDEPDAYLDRLAVAKDHEWSRRGVGWVFSADMKDWSKYCSSFARKMGLDPGSYRP
ncbi:hypothetical protein MWU52_05755 [Jannaschia sp. S6380]|uniref:hypothetical protein n=1 Tax=Jannaschia sp. S6380 TaxID=2926408 RepID=UPI001FF53CA9|nr:hypothetical protein [Jannaschia sp. S6380]MCK0167048.1 hypothetical protein [Jannaschia sp. S6380]